MTLLELFKLLQKHLTLVVALPVVLALATAGVSWGLMQNQYTATVSVYVLSSSTGDQSKIQNSDLTASQLMANDIAELATSDIVTERTAEELGMSSLSGYDVSVNSSTTTRVIEISVESGDPQAAATVANKMSEVLSSVAQEVTASLPSERPTHDTSKLCVNRLCTNMLPGNGKTCVLFCKRRKGAEKISRS